MPETISFSDEHNNAVEIEEINETNKPYNVEIPLEYNSMAIIDGQHRAYAFYEDIINDDEEKKIAVQRSRYCLLVTGIIYPKDDNWTEEKKGWKYHFKDYKEEKFPYSGSNYNKLAKEVIIPLFEERIKEKNENTGEE